MVEGLRFWFGVAVGYVSTDTISRVAGGEASRNQLGRDS